jgi:hypothetical protein
VRHLHAATAAAGRCLDEHRIADVAGKLLGLGDVGDGAVGARHHRQAEGLGRALGLDLVAHDAQMLGRRADERDAMLAQNLGKAGILRQEAVAGMDRIGAGDLAGRDQGGDIEIALGGRRRADAHAFVGQAHVHGVLVGGGMHRHRLDAQLAAGAQHPQGDLAAIGDQDLVEHADLVASSEQSLAGRRPRMEVASISPPATGAYGARTSPGEEKRMPAFVAGIHDGCRGNKAPAVILDCRTSPAMTWRVSAEPRRNLTSPGGRLRRLEAAPAGRIPEHPS